MEVSSKSRFILENFQSKDIDGVIYCEAGGKIGTYSQLTKNKSDDIACLISAEKVGMERASVKVGTKDDLDKGKGLLVEFLKY
jgi:hypothetical protein